ncbi:uncharacterized protein LOC115424955 [Sphaeramia orbicularis]|uniref:uncharacterized protein LOC115424955 n=1 Tax=Sphaeramia orbicularis TaxID=375764 RepID=UPI00117F5AC2|nr:uncharacterized protein LOC115424955 [Sphaeramia orbicularis]XP_029998238.1 uncharacterized protein LOC115424955 [Sphaeramia orbicularis]
MEAELQGSSSDLAMMHVKTEALDENPSALVLGSREPPAPCGLTACGGGGGGGGGVGVGDQTAEELQAATTNTPVLLYPVNTDRFFTTSGDGKTYLKIAPASGMSPAPSEKTLPTGSDFSSKAVLCLIEAVGRRWGLYETRERSQLFQSVQEEMASKGHMLPVEKIRRKWNNLIVTYKRVKDRSRETGHAKTSWEFFDLMDATLCDTVGSQIISNKRNKGVTTASTLPGALAKIAAKPQVPQPTPIIRPNGDFTATGGVENRTQTVASNQMNIISTTSTITSLTTATISPTSTPEIKPLIVVNGDLVTTSVHPATIVPSPPFISSPSLTETASTSTSNIDLNTSRFMSRKAPSYSSGVLPFRLNSTQLSNSQNLLSLSSSFSPTSSCLTSPVTTSLSATALSRTEGQSQKGNEDQTSTALFREILKRQEEQAYLDRVARRRVEAREKRRERREVRMAESLGRVATALELLSSKQDTVIALLQRLADRK